MSAPPQPCTVEASLDQRGGFPDGQSRGAHDDALRFGLRPTQVGINWLRTLAGGRIAVGKGAGYAARQNAIGAMIATRLMSRLTYPTNADDNIKLSCAGMPSEKRRFARPVIQMKHSQRARKARKRK